ncbi:N-acetyltransferase [Opitutus sp. GAS368]|uniref:GNAT family N-acetyltransferase n=1 Tax=Opitutus sp. GAS368 TaxID=1882749 RepID=UPI00087D1C51|nr:N-acetyltransferase [Opitutus sp. GAS368]SDR86415.1 Ribosomal protein S18 acetylase RimI [Opitutus sp. GAS368]
MNPPPVLRRATPADAAVALSWTPEDDALRRWAGPSTRCPATPESLWTDINHADTTAFAFGSPGHGLVGFGQVRFREQTYGHLARIIVSPHHRGLGLGRALCTALMREALKLHPTITGYSLYVFPDNLNAIALYRSLGFADRGMHPSYHCMLMEAPLPAAPRIADCVP